MPPRSDKIVKILSVAIDNIQRKKYDQAEKKLISLREELQGVKPKKKANEYALFVQQNYPIFKSRHPNMDVQEIMKLIAEAWKETKKV